MIGITYTYLKGERIYGWLKPQHPFDLAPFKRKVEDFLAPVQRGQRVFIAFNDPKENYEKIFDGYRNLIEIFSVVATQKDFHIFPDWHLIFMHGEYRHFWGREPSRVWEIMNNWNADYVIIYNNDRLENKPNRYFTSFELVSELDWNTLVEKMGHDYPYSNNHPKMFLLKKINTIS